MMVMGKGRALLLVIGVAIAGLFALLFIARQPAPPATVSTPEASPSSTPSVDSSLLDQLSSDIAAKFTSRSKPGDPAYLASIKPYLTEQAFAAVVYENERAARSPIYISTTSRALETTTVIEDSSLKARSTVQVLTREQNGQEYRQTVGIQWVKVEGRWSVEFIQIDSSDKNPAG